MLSDEVRELEKDYSEASKTIARLTVEKQALAELVEKYENLCKMVIPNKVYTHKNRKNTTVKFLDGSQQTVTRRAGEQDCIETAIAYCILKQILTAKEVKKLVEEREEH